MHRHGCGQHQRDDPSRVFAQTGGVIMKDELEIVTDEVFDAPTPAAAPTEASGPSEVARWITVAVLGVVVIGLTAAAPAGLRRIDAFRIDRVEIYGAHYMTAE